MKKRLRKKLHKGEFAKIGISVRVSVTDANVADILDKLAEMADENRLIFYGGGAGHIITPGEEYGNITMPWKVEFLMLALMPDPYLSADAIIGYYADPVARSISDNRIESVKKAINSLNVEHDANYSVDLWN